MTKTNLELPPAILTIFGITGDLSKRKLLPSLYYLTDDNMLPPSFRIVGITRRGTTPDEVIETVREAMHERGKTCNEATLEKLKAAIVIVKMDITDLAEYVRLKTQLDKIEDELGVCLSRLFYLAMPAQVFMPAVQLLSKSSLNTGCQHGSTESRLLIEKPLGYDLNSATELITTIAASFKDKQLYLIDHYLAKEAVQTLLASRLKSTVLEPLWNKDHVNHIIITADESIGIENRVIFYEEMGALRDVVQSHLIQLLSVVAMERPADASAAAIHTAKLKLMKAVQPPAADEMDNLTIRGQYNGYRQEVNNPDSMVETFAAVSLRIDNERWQGVPIILRTGKKLAAKATKVTIVFKDADKAHNLIIHIEPNKDAVDSSADKIIYQDDYEQVLVAAINGDKTLFATKEEVLASWRIVDPILAAWTHNRTKLSSYQPGSEGPESFKEL